MHLMLSEILLSANILFARPFAIDIRRRLPSARMQPIYCKTANAMLREMVKNVMGMPVPAVEIHCFRPSAYVENKQ